MFNRHLQLPKDHSFFLFGARGTGKTHLLKSRFQNENVLFVDLLDPELEARYTLDPNRLRNQIRGMPTKPEIVVIDEVQKVPKLLDLVHQMIESDHQHFALSGSSARKLRHGSANLLAGRALMNYLYPLTHRELGEAFNLDDVLQWGSLPQIFLYQDDQVKADYLRTYSHLYLKEEIQQEQIIRKLDPFRRFLGVAAQMNGFILNFSKIAREVGTSTPTIQNYFQILEDTLIGFLLEPFHESVRKQQRANPKFYLIDTGIARALANQLTLPLRPQTYQYGIAFEQFIMNELFRLNQYAKKDYRLSYLTTKSGNEIDVVLERPGMPRALIEIKSTRNLSEQDLKGFISIASDIPNSEAFCFSQDPMRQNIQGIQCLPWIEGIQEVGL
jgi:predicted AAA+ superfamily ATPase